MMRGMICRPRCLLWIVFVPEVNLALILEVMVQGIAKKA
jgi:hypothetical protein